MQEISRRIRGVRGTMQITRAMEMVSSVKLRRAKESLEESRPYYRTVLKNIQSVLTTVRGVKHPLLEEREVKNTLYIVLTSDRGLAGGYNSNVNKMTAAEIRDEGKNAKLITVGLKAYDYFKNREEVIEHFLGISEDPHFLDAVEIAKIALDLYKKGEIDEVRIAYTRFESMIKQTPRILQLLPAVDVYEGKDSKEAKKAGELMEFEPSAEEVLDYLIPMFIESTIYGALVEASASEQGARQLAMESATDNAEEIIDDLELTYNRARQEAITMEISEIVSGAEALK